MASGSTWRRRCSTTGGCATGTSFTAASGAGHGSGASARCTRSTGTGAGCSIPTAGAWRSARSTADPAPGLLRYYGDGDELHLSFYFWFLKQPWRATAFRAAVGSFDVGLPHGSWANYTLSNHDRPRHATRFGLERARVAAMMLLTLRGTSFLYYGEEIGMTDVPPGVQDRGRRRPGPGANADAVGGRAGRRVLDRRSWSPIGPDTDRVNVEAQRSDPASLFSLYRRLTWYRKGSPALRAGTYRAMRNRGEVFAFVREQGDERLLVALNFAGEESRLVPRSLPARGMLELSTDPERASCEVSLRPLLLGPNEGVIVRLG